MTIKDIALIIKMLKMQSKLDKAIMDEYGLDKIDEDKLSLAILDEVGELTHELKGKWCWWKSCDYSEDTYRRTVTEFKKKWFKQTKIDVQKQIESKFEQTKDELIKEFEYLKGDE